MGASFTKFRLFFHNVFLIINTLFTTLHVKIHARCVKVYVEMSEIFTHAVFQLVVARKTASSECVLQGTKEMAERGCQIGAEGRMRTWLNFLFGRKLRIRFLGVFSVFTYRSELIGHLEEFYKLLSFTVLEDARYDFPNRSLRLQFTLSHPPLQFRFSTFRLPSFFWLAEGWSPRTQFFGRRRAATQPARRAPTFQQRVLRDWHTASHAKVEKLCW